jgi:hypothetical protein
MWAVDVEFPGVTGANSIPFYISVRDIWTERVVLLTSIDHDGIALKEIERLVVEHYGGRNTPVWCWVAHFSRFYPGSLTTTGMSLAAVGDHLRDAGFSPQTHHILSWYSSMDIAVVCRALLGHSQLFDFTPLDGLCAQVDESSQILQPFNIATLARGMHKLDDLPSRVRVQIHVPG